MGKESLDLSDRAKNRALLREKLMFDYISILALFLVGIAFRGLNSWYKMCFTWDIDIKCYISWKTWDVDMWRDSHGIPMGFLAFRSLLKNPSPRFWWQAVERPRPREPKHRGLYPKGGVFPKTDGRFVTVVTVETGGFNLPKIPEIPLTLPGSTNRRLEWLDSEDLYFLLNMGKNSSNSMLDAIFPITSSVPVEKAGLFERFHDPIDWRISHPFRSHQQESKTKTRTWHSMTHPGWLKTGSL